MSMRKVIASVFLGYFITSCAHLRRGKDAAVWEPAVSSHLKKALGAAGKPVAGETLTARPAVLHFYKARHFQPAWLPGGAPSDQVIPFLQAIDDSENDGLIPAQYHREAAARLLKQIGTGESPPLVDAQLDILLTDAYITLGSHLYVGKLNPNALNEDWLVKRRGAKLSALLASAIAAGDVVPSLQRLAPSENHYAELRERFKAMREGAAGVEWPRVPSGGFTLRVGDRDPRIAALRARLSATRDYRGSAGDESLFDEGLDAALKAFQASHGLKPDGFLDSATLAELNVPARDRLDELAANLERLRWLPRKLGDRYVFVDIANYKLDVFDGGRSVLDMKVVVGKGDKETPMISDAIQQIVLNPSWSLPSSIVEEELLPKLKRDPSYLARRKMKIFETVEGSPREVASSDIDWSQVSAADVRKYTLQQPPGPANPLGSIKFLFPNPYSVYLHGTPEQGGFHLKDRALSHGCIRVERPLDLATYLLKDDNGRWSKEELLKTIAAHKEKTITLARPVEVYLFYRTAWIGDDGALNFRRDIYDWDAPVVAALRQAPARARLAE